MKQEKSITQILEDAKHANILAEIDGKKYVTFEDYVNLTTAEKVDGNTKISLPPLNPDGSPAGSMVKYLAVSIEQLLLNRYKVEDDKVYVVTDWWSITEQESGRLPRKRIPCYVIGRKGKELVLEKTTTISDNEFLTDFTKILNREAMSQILPLITNKDRDITEDKLPI